MEKGHQRFKNEWKRGGAGAEHFDDRKGNGNHIYHICDPPPHPNGFINEILTPPPPFG